MVILLCDSFGSELPGALSRFGEVTSDVRRLAEAEVALVRSKTRVDRAFIDAAPALRLVIRGGVGLDNVDLACAEERGIDVRNTPEASTVSVAELAFLLILAMPNHLALADRSTRDGLWLKKELERTELLGKTLGIAGYGRIGEALAVRAAPFGMRVLGWRRTPSGGESAEMVPSLESLVERSDTVSLHLPLGRDTRSIVGADLLAHFRDGSYLVKTGRGECVDERAVADALRSGKLAGFATDVWHAEPPVGSPLLDAPNVLATPHLGASARESLARVGVSVEAIIERHVAGRSAR